MKKLKKDSKLYKFLKAIHKNMYFDQSKELDKVAFSYLKNCERILDIGCGIGIFISQNPDKIIGLDHNQESVSICRNHKYNVVQGKATDLPFPDSSFDGLHCSHLIEHLFPEEAHKLLFEMNRVLRKGGRICIRAPLLHPEFYYNLTHIKPYYPQAILHYLKTSKKYKRTLSDIDGVYKIVKLKYRRAKLFTGLINRQMWFLTTFANLINKLGINSLRKNGYMLILEKTD